MLTKIIIALIMIGIISALVSGLIHIIKDKDNSNRVVKSLTWRIGLSLFLFILLFIAFAFGLIAPHGIQQ